MPDKISYEFSIGGGKQKESYAEEMRREAKEHTLRVGHAIYIDRQKIKDVISINIHQPYGDHQTLKLRIYASEVHVEPSFYMNGSEKLIGKKLLLSLLNVNNKLETDTMDANFIITEVEFDQNYLSDGILIITGKSASYLLDKVPGCETFVDLSLGFIVEQVTRGILRQGGYELTCNPRTQTTIPFACRFNETAWQFLKRMAGTLGEYIYNTGTELVFGYPNSQEQAHITYGGNCAQLKMKARLAAPQGSLFDYDSYSDSKKNYAANDKVETAFGINEESMKMGTQLFGLNHHTHTRSMVNEGSLLSEVAESTSKGMANNSYIVSGESTLFALHPGQILKLDMKREGKSASHKALLILSVKHHYEAGGKYHNEWEATWADMQVPPMLSYQQPTTYPILAEVVNNTTEPGRVKVDFLNWRSKHGDTHTGFIRVASLTGGSSSKVPQNRGFVFMPEISEMVWVNFENGCPEKPFVMGSAFNGKNGKGGSADNNIKSIITRSGHTIEFNDAADGTHIIIKDPGGNTIHMDTQGKNITITAPETMTLNAKNMKINIEENMDVIVKATQTIDIGKNKTERIGDTLKLETGSHTEIVHNSKEVTIEKGSINKAQFIKIESADGNITTVANGLVVTQGKEIKFQ